MLGSTTLRWLLDIFWPLMVHQPWAKMVSGRGSPALMSIVGQYTAWWRRMSLPMRCTVAGQNLPYFSASSPKPPRAEM